MTACKSTEFDLVAADELIAARTDSQSFACERGCAWCCHQLVVMTNHDDGRVILNAARNRMSAAQFQAFESAAREQAEQIGALPYEEAETQQWTCPLLIDDQCAVYDVRPIACRSVSSPDPECCKAMLEAERYDDLTPKHRELATRIGERALALQIAVNDRRPIDGPIELRDLLARLLDEN